MTKRTMLPRELNNVRSAYRKDLVNQRLHELQSHAEDVKTSLNETSERGENHQHHLYDL